MSGFNSAEPSTVSFATGIAALLSATKNLKIGTQNLTILHFQSVSNRTIMQKATHAPFLRWIF